jgi:hypothetical protein
LKWLQVVEATAYHIEITGRPVFVRIFDHVHANSHSAAENKIISWIRALVAEALESLDPSAIGIPSQNAAYLTPSQLGKAVLQIWSRTLSGNSLWPMIRQISETFHILGTRDDSTLA